MTSNIDGQGNRIKIAAGRSEAVVQRETNKQADVNTKAKQQSRI